ncbi:MAG TPA: magnesium transporter CorA family protein [Anaerolineae bacterium]|nr:magnesium transporter CorA family protein [Anaerolineae bacterium]HQH38097.1 magnesium transporter CorA family protein [Anaerolineae bacterium]
MITFLKTTEEGLLRVNEVVPGCWIRATDPTPEEVAQLQALGVPQDFISYALDLDERSRVEKSNGDTLIVVKIPHYQGDTSDIPYIAIPLGIMLAPNFVVTICRVESDLLRDAAAGRLRGLSTGKRNRFTLYLFLGTATRYLHCLREINRRVDELEDKLQRSMRNQEVLELLKYEKSLTYFTTALKSNELMMERLQRNQLFQTYPDDLELLEDVLTENRQAIEMVNISSAILSQMMDAFASIISNNLNVVMKFLASITIIISLPTVVASFFGMNVHLPLENSPFAFPIILIISVAIAVLVAWNFSRRDWL